jgi:hypothetical protein
MEDYEKATEDIMKIFSDPFFQNNNGDTPSEPMEIEF